MSDGLHSKLAWGRVKTTDTECVYTGSCGGRVVIKGTLVQCRKDFGGGAGGGGVGKCSLSWD